MAAPRNMARQGNAKAIDKVEAQKNVLARLRAGDTIPAAMKAVARTPETYKAWMKAEDPSFANSVREIRNESAKQTTEGRQAVPDFPEFCQELGQPLYPHQLRILDMLEGREPRDLHMAMTWEAGDSTRAIANMPTGHAKTISFSVNYVVWRIHRDPNIKIIVVSQSQGLAKDIVGGIKFRLTSPLYAAMHQKYAPEGGWKDVNRPWTQTEVFVSGRTSDAIDPTVQALGMQGQIYGSRADLVILDDAVTMSNVGQYENQLNWLNQEVDSRLPPEGGQMLILGTRVASVDLYSEIRKMRDEDDRPAYSYLAQPAVLDFGNGTSDSWETLWPETQDADGNVREMWSGRRLAKKKARYSTRAWSLTQQQAEIAEDAPFPPEIIECNTNRRRFHGPMVDGAPGHRHGGMNGVHVVAGYDPAAGGYSAFVVLGVDKLAQRCWILDMVNKKDMHAADVQATIKRLTNQYDIKEWVIETNAMNRYVSQDPEITGFLRARGTRLRPHHTGANKADPDFGVLSIGPMFAAGAEKTQAGPWRRNEAKVMLDIPNPRNLKASAELIQQLVTWVPNAPRTQKTDLVMALWFAVIAARDALGLTRGNLPTHSTNAWLTKRDLRQRGVINLAAMREERLRNAG